LRRAKLIDSLYIYLAASQEQIDKAKEIVKKLRFNYTPERFENPVLQRHYANVEALALELDEPEETNDTAGKLHPSYSAR
jgi:hypothetical protein